MHHDLNYRTKNYCMSFTRNNTLIYRKYLENNNKNNNNATDIQTNKNTFDGLKTLAVTNNANFSSSRRF